MTTVLYHNNIYYSHDQTPSPTPLLYQQL